MARRAEDAPACLPPLQRRQPDDDRDDVLRVHRRARRRLALQRLIRRRCEAAFRHPRRRARRDAVAGHAVAPQRLRVAAHQPQLAGVRRRVVRLPGRPADARVGGEVDDPPVALVAVGAPVDRGELGRRETALQVHPHRLVPVILGHVEDHPLAQDAVRADQDVEVAVRVEGRLDGPLGSIHVCDIAAESHRLPAGCADRLDHDVDARGRPVGPPLDVPLDVADHDLRPLLAEDLADLRADPAGPARHERDASVEMSCHGTPPPQSLWARRTIPGGPTARRPAVVPRPARPASRA